MKALKKNMKDQILDKTDHKILHCPNCDSEFSGNNGDYFFKIEIFEEGELVIDPIIGGTKGIEVDCQLEGDKLPKKHEEEFRLNNYNIDIDTDEASQQIAIINENKNPLKANYKGSIVATLNKDVLSYIDLNINFVSKINSTDNTNTVVYNISNKSKIVNTNKENSKSNSILVIFAIIAVIEIIYLIFKRKIKKEESFEEHFYRFKKR